MYKNMSRKVVGRNHQRHDKKKLGNFKVFKQGNSLRIQGSSWGKPITHISKGFSIEILWGEQGGSHSDIVLLSLVNP